MGRRKKSDLPLELDARELAQLLGLTRAVLGAGMYLAPRLFTRAWLGDARESSTTKLAMRGFGARDVILGMGTLMALERGRAVRGWLEAGIAADVSDVVSAAVTQDVPLTRRALTVAAAGLGVAWGASILSEFDD